MDGTAIAQLGTDRAGTALEKACARALLQSARTAAGISRQQLRAATRRFARRHRRDAAYLGWVLRSAGASSALALALLGLAGHAFAALPPFAPFAPDPLAGQSVVSRSTPALGDLDGDGDFDLVSGNAGGELHYFANTGNRSSPSFEPRTGAANPFDGFDVGGNVAPALADLDADGDLDLVVGNDAGTLAYFENTGTTTTPAFAARSGAASPVGGLVVGICSAPALGDLDRDGDLDLVVGDLNGVFRYFANTGTATAPAFAAQTGAANPLDGFNAGTASKPALGDLDRDGDLDLVAGRADGTFGIYENTGTAVSPSFVERTGAANPLDARDVGDRSAPALGDLDGDGDADLVAGSDSGAFAAFRNLRSPDALPEFAGNMVESPALGDLDGDGDLDLVSEGRRYFHYFENTGGGFAAFVQRTGAASPLDGAPLEPYPPCRNPALADLDGDGDLDLVSGRYPGRFCYFENTGTATSPAFVERTGTASPLDGVGNYAAIPAPAFEDLDGDGDLDLVAGADLGNDLEYFQNTGSTTHPAFVHRTGSANPFDPIFPNYSYYLYPTLGDLDGDGDLDCVVGSGDTGRFEYLENTGTPVSPAFALRTGPQNPLSQYVGNPPRPALGDLDGDGDLDLIADVFFGKSLTFENTGLPNLPAFIQKPASDPISDLNLAFSAAAFPDLDHDGDVDLVTAGVNEIGPFSFFENTSTGLVPSFVQRTGAANPLYGNANISMVTPAFADLDGDGDLDLLTGSFTFGNDPGPFYYFANTGDATSPHFAARVQNPFGLSTPSGAGPASAPMFGDVDGDGDGDLAVGFGDGRVRYYENTGSHSSPAFVQRTAAENPFDVVQLGGITRPALGDFDRDGDLDLITGFEGAFQYFWNTGSAIAPAFTPVIPPLRDPLDGQDGAFAEGGPWNRSSPAPVDLDGDGDLDFVDSSMFVYYAPEPARGLLFGAGALLLRLLARWRRQPRQE